VGGPDAHSSKHAVSGELANHPLFQKARVNALYCDAMQVHFQTLDAGNPMKVHVNFSDSIVKATFTNREWPVKWALTLLLCLFVYCKPNPGNSNMNSSLPYLSFTLSAHGK
jgi:hypothetical protein